MKLEYLKRHKWPNTNIFRIKKVVKKTYTEIYETKNPDPATNQDNDNGSNCEDELMEHLYN